MIAMVVIMIITMTIVTKMVSCTQVMIMTVAVKMMMVFFWCRLARLAGG